MSKDEDNGKGLFEEKDPRAGKQGKGWYEIRDSRTHKGLEHQRAALKGKGNQLSNAEIVPEMDFKQTMYIGYTTEHGYPEFMEIKMEISNTGKGIKKGNQISMSGTEGEIMKTSVLEERVEEYWENINMEDEYGYVADGSIGEEPSEDEVEAKMPLNTPSMEEDEDKYVDAYEIAYDEAMEVHKEKRKEFLDRLMSDLKSEDYPFERHAEKYINGEFYTLTSHSGGQVLDRAKDYTPVIPESDLDFIIESWENHHLFGAFGPEDKPGRSEPSIETMQRLIKIHEEYESRDGDLGHIKKMIDATGI